MKQFIKSLIPPIALNILKRIQSSKYGWNVNYKSWKEAQNASTGYDSDEIIQKVRTSLLRVKNGEAVYERDSVIFDEVQYSWPLLAGLMFASAKSGGVLKVLDFGGSLGSTYFQNKKFLDMLDSVSWSIVEQKHFVDVGKADFEDERLKFYYDVKSCFEGQKPNVLLLSSVLQYIEKPYELLDEFLKYDFEFVIFDRTPFSTANKDIVKLQTVPPSIYTASYPCWFFDLNTFLEYFTNKYKLVEIFDALDGKSDEYEFKGFVFGKKDV
ncbi:MAG: methyltransferase, TIGR04325 family [Epsilonproteobacteria bacterium]|nr:methyltransferase, TIGR04325 family [Campylobacterota bacterium]